MKIWLEGIRAWYRRRFRGFVAAPALHGGAGTSWQEHKRHEIGFTCTGITASGEPCGQVLAFMSTDLIVRARNHEPHCTELSLAEIAQVHSVFHDGDEKARLRMEMLNSAGRAAGYPMGCGCPITDARYVKICPTCKLGHWKDVTPKSTNLAARSHA